MAYNISPSDPVWIDSNYSMRNTNNFSWMPKKEMVSWLGPAFPTMVTFQPLAGPGSVTWPMVDGHQIPHSEKTTQIEGSDICLNSFKSRFQIERYLQWNGGDCGGRVGPRCSFDVFLGGEPCVPKQFFKNKIKFPFFMSSLIWKQHSLRLALCNSERGLSIMSRGKGDIFLLLLTTIFFLTTEHMRIYIETTKYFENVYRRRSQYYGGKSSHFKMPLSSSDCGKPPPTLST